MVEGAKDYRGQRDILSLCASPAQSSLNVAAVPHRFWEILGLLLGLQSLALGLGVKLWDATAASIFMEPRAAPQPCETHPSSNWGCSTAIPRSSPEQASSYNRCQKKVTSGAAEQVKKPFDLQVWGCLRSPNKSRATLGYSSANPLHPWCLQLKGKTF